jgi:TPR repeat protein
LAEGQSNLALMYENGSGVPKDEAAAALWYLKAADQGYAAAQLAIARLYRQGKGLPRDLKQAETWEAKAKATRLAQLKQ